VPERTLIIPRLSGSEAQALTTLARHAVDLPLPGWPGPHLNTALLSLRCMPPDTPVILTSSALRMAVEWAGACLWLDLPRTAVERWLAGALGAVWPQVPQLAPEWQHLAQVQASGWLMQALSQSGRGVAQCTGFQSQTDKLPVASRHHLLVSLQVQTDAALAADVFHGVLHTDSLGLLLVAGLVADHPGQAPATLDEDLCPQPLTLCLGETLLPLTAVENFQPGQVVFVQQCYAQGDQQLCLRSESAKSPWMAFEARLEKTQLHILSTVKNMTLPDTLSTPVSSSDGEHEFLAQLPVRVSFDLGETVLSLAQVKTLQPGETLQLQRPAQEYVTIRANGMPIGTGQLVEIDGRLGVAIGSLTSGTSGQVAE
jgi:type III secretion protein Q